MDLEIKDINVVKNNRYYICNRTNKAKNNNYDLYQVTNGIVEKNKFKTVNNEDLGSEYICDSSSEEKYDVSVLIVGRTIENQKEYNEEQKLEEALKGVGVDMTKNIIVYFLDEVSTNYRYNYKYTGGNLTMVDYRMDFNSNIIKHTFDIIFIDDAVVKFFDNKYTLLIILKTLKIEGKLYIRHNYIYTCEDIQENIE